LEEAKKQLRPVDRRQEELLKAIQRIRLLTEKDREEVQRQRQLVEALRKQLEQEQEAFQERRQRLEAEANEALEAKLRQLRERLLQRLRPFQNVPAHWREAVEVLRREVEGLLQASPLQEHRKRRLRQIRPLEPVYLPRLRQRGLVEKVDWKKERVRVRIGSLHVDVPFEEVEFLH